ncbi:MAG: PAAR domain-containing protein [Deltaproteobacteria bacterium]|nr:PAAR domain-containing protein [Deltaproteobacteria bacterium]
MPAAARISDMHVCPKVEPGPVPHVGGPILPAGEPTVLIGAMPAARAGDPALCVGPPDGVAQGEPTVLIGGRKAARVGDKTEHGGAIIAGCPTVLIGSSAQADVLRAAARRGSPFCEKCVKERRQRARRSAGQVE